jgi:hypothetical protein
MREIQNQNDKSNINCQNQQNESDLPTSNSLHNHHQSQIQHHNQASSQSHCVTHKIIRKTSNG